MLVFMPQDMAVAEAAEPVMNRSAACVVVMPWTGRVSMTSFLPVYCSAAIFWGRPMPSPTNRKTYLGGLAAETETAENSRQ